MADINELTDDDVVVVFTGENGEELYYVEDEVFSVDDETYAVMVPVPAEESVEHEHCHCGHHHHEHEGCNHFHEHHPEAVGDEAIIAKIITGSDGELEYIEPSDEEFDKALAALESLLEEGEETI